MQFVAAAMINVFIPRRMNGGLDRKQIYVSDEPRSVRAGNRLHLHNRTGDVHAVVVFVVVIFVRVNVGVVIVIIVVVIHVFGVDKGIGTNLGKVLVFELVVAFANVRRYLVQVFLAIDRAAKEKLSLRVLGRQDLFAVDRFEFHFALIVGEHDGRARKNNSSNL